MREGGFVELNGVQPKTDQLGAFKDLMVVTRTS